MGWCQNRLENTQEPDLWFMSEPLFSVRRPKSDLVHKTLLANLLYAVRTVSKTDGDLPKGVLKNGFNGWKRSTVSEM